MTGVSQFRLWREKGETERGEGWWELGLTSRYLVR